MPQISEARFPMRGVDQSQDLAGQPSLTTPVGINVRFFEALTRRGRGGSRPGTFPLSPGQVPAGSHLIQHLNTVITTDANAVGIVVPDPSNPVFPNPSTPGLPQYWGYYPNGTPRGTRSPQDGFPPGGTGWQPNKNAKQTHHLTVYGPSGVKYFSDVQTWTGGIPFFTGFLAPSDTLTATYSSAGDPAMSPVGTYAVNVTPTLTSNTGDVYVIDSIVQGTLVVQPDPPPTPKYCWGGKIQIRITKPAPDPFHWTGQTVFFIGETCASAQPGTGLTAKIGTAQEGLPIGTTLLALAARYLKNHVGTDSYGTVILDQVSSTHSVAVCAADDGTCTPIPANVNASPGSLGTIIGAG